MSGTPVVPQRKRITRQSVQNHVDSKRWRYASPTILVPDSVKKAGPSPWDAFDEAQDPADSSLLDPTWRISDLSIQNEDTLSELPSDLHRNPHSGPGTRCKCRGECLNRCSCRRAGHECTAGHCRCVLGKCQNRGSATKQADANMGPPVVVPLGQKNKRRKTETALNQIQESTVAVSGAVQHVPPETKALLNRTFDLEPDENRTPDAPHADLLEASVPLVDIGGKLLWPKTRLSYFPSPSLRADM
ncbi:unnamed protein product [Echinostoma caproni]|uniref:Tesmin/TSO1-like CXC domain-containing protein n=1 Tax=Echinostoma caproni TaxID=27848 RepID=A0A3P8L8W8_9TREM|nr:unnamed protein product [Echinostoma caproni]